MGLPSERGLLAGQEVLARGHELATEQRSKGPFLTPASTFWTQWQRKETRGLRSDISSLCSSATLRNLVFKIILAGAGGLQSAPSL